MINKIIAEYLRTNKRLVVPHFGAFIRKENSEAIVFVPFLKKDDGVLNNCSFPNTVWTRPTHRRS